MARADLRLKGVQAEQVMSVVEVQEAMTRPLNVGVAFIERERVGEFLEAVRREIPVLEGSGRALPPAEGSEVA
jgi:hypothetical protein